MEYYFFPDKQKIRYYLELNIERQFNARLFVKNIEKVSPLLWHNLFSDEAKFQVNYFICFVNIPLLVTLLFFSAKSHRNF